MKQLLLLTILFALSALAKSQIKMNGYYINNRSNKNEGKFIHRHNKLLIQYQVNIKDSNRVLHTFTPDDIKGFTFEIGSVKRTYESVAIKGNKIFLQILAGTKTVKEYSYYYLGRKGIREKYLVIKNDTLIEPGNDEKHNEYLARVFSDYPLLSDMAHKKQFDDLNGTENNIIFDEYNFWVSDTTKRNIADTSSALKGILDANRDYKPNKFFWYSFLTNRLLTPIIGLPLMAKPFDTKPNNFDLKIQKKYLSNKEYMAAYEARAFTKKRKAIAKGTVFSFIP